MGDLLNPAILPIIPGASRNEIVPPFADSFIILRSPSNAMTVLQQQIVGTTIDEVLVLAGEKCPIIDLLPSTTVVRITNTGAVDITNQAHLFFLTF